MRKYCSIILLILISNLIAQDSTSSDTVLRRIDCATPTSTEEQILQTRQIVENWLSDNRDRPEEQVHILVRFMLFTPVTEQVTSVMKLSMTSFNG